MSYYNYDFDIAAIALYAIIFIQTRKRKHIKNFHHFVTESLMLCSFFTPVFDILGSIVIELQASRTLVMSLNMAYYLSEQASTFCFFAYIITKYEIGSRISNVRKALILAPIVCITVVILSNPLTGLMFTYDGGVYKSGIFRAVCYAVPVAYFLWFCIYVFVHKELVSKELRKIACIVAVLNVLPRVRQYFESGMLIHSFFVAISVTLIYFYEEKNDTTLDPVTGLANKAYLEEASSKLLHSKSSFTAVLVRIADYDLLSSSYGIDKAEKLMTEIGMYLQSLVPTGMAFKLSSEYYVLHLVGRTDDAGLKEKIYNRINEGWIIDNEEIACTSFITSVTCPNHFQDKESYFAYITYFRKMHRLRYGIMPVEEMGIKDKLREQKVLQAIERAINAKSFRIYYQPIIDTKTGVFTSAEALVRLHDEELGFVPPMEFIPLAEREGTIVQVGSIIMEKLFEFLATNDLSKYGVEYIEMNLSTIECLQRDFIDRLDSMVDKYKISSDKICFEITETASNCAPEIFTENLKAITDRGFKLALDDFGSGYANLQRLITSKFDIIKFDKDMIQKTCESESLKDVFARMVIMFHSLSSKVVAEGVELEEQKEYLKKVDCDYIQGYFYARPMPEDEYLTFLEESLGRSYK